MNWAKFQGRVLLLVFVYAAVLVSCASMQLTPKERYLEARTQFNNTLEAYIYQLERVKDPELKNELAAKVSPLFFQGDKLLDAWSLALDQGLDTLIYSNQFRELKDRIIDLIMETGLP